MARDGYVCTLCGIAGGEAYADAGFTTAQLEVTVRRVGGDGSKIAYLTECTRCRAGAIPTAEVTFAQATSLLDTLSPEQQALLAMWIKDGRRRPTDVDRAWTAFRRFGDDDRAAFCARLGI